jgi:hypothetical protein
MFADAPSFSRNSVLRFCAVPIALSALLMAGCSSTLSTSSQQQAATSASEAFVIGTDAPVASVVSFDATISSINAIDANGNSAELLSSPQTVDFARFNGLQTLLDMNDVPADTYTQIAVAFSGATIGYLQTSAGSPPAIETMTASLTTSTVTVTLANPLIVSQTGPVGIRLDFRLDKSIVVSGGSITGQVNPTLDITAVGPNDPGGYIDEFIAGVVSVDQTAQSFVIEGPHGRNFTVDVSGQTEWDDGSTLADLTSTSIVQISGIIDRADSTIDADEVLVLSQNGFYAAGTTTYVDPASGPANDFQFYVRGTLPASGDGVTLGQIAQVNLTGNENYYIYWMHNRFTQFLFDRSALLPGQHIAVGGSLTGAANAQALSVNRVVLRDWGFNGTIVPGTVNTGNGAFQMQISGFAGVLIPQTVTVYTAGNTSYRDGFSGLNDVSAGMNIRVVGLLLEDPASGETILLARHVDDMDN